ncbi:MAG: hypothetical protein ACYCY7_03890 [Gallionella sp.]
MFLLCSWFISLMSKGALPNIVLRLQLGEYFYPKEAPNKTVRGEGFPFGIEMPSSFHHSQFVDMLWLHLQTWNAQISRQLSPVNLRLNRSFTGSPTYPCTYSHERQTLIV